MAYEKQTWTAGDAITQQRMAHIEDGIAGAAATADANTSGVTTAQARADSAYQLADTADKNITQIRLDIRNMSVDTSNGTAAWTQVQPAITMSGDTVTKSLNQRLVEDETAIADINAKIGGNYSDISTVSKDITSVREALSTTQGIVNRATGDYTDLQARLDAMDETLSTNTTSINGVSDLYDNARGTYASIEKRFEASEQEIGTARGTYTNLNARISADESTIENQGNQIII